MIAAWIAAAESAAPVGSAPPAYALFSTLTPVAAAYGYDKVFFGIVMIHNLEIGFLLPPLGLNLLIGMTAFKAKMVELTKAAVPFIVLMILGLVIIIWQPWIAMALVSR